MRQSFVGESEMVREAQQQLMEKVEIDIRHVVRSLESIWNEVGYSDEERGLQMDKLCDELTQTLRAKLAQEIEVRDVFKKDIEAKRAECEAFDRSGAPQDLRFELPRGGRVEGRLRFPAGFPVGSRRVGFLPTGAASPRDVVVASLGTDGGFTIGPIDAGPGRLYLLTARGYSLRGGALVPGDLLGGIEIVEGETSAVEYDAPVG